MRLTCRPSRGRWSQAPGRRPSREVGPLILESWMRESTKSVSVWTGCRFCEDDADHNDLGASKIEQRSHEARRHDGVAVNIR
jgi:hypothetical protein